MATAHRPKAHAEAEALLRRHGHHGSQVKVVRSPGDAIDGCLTFYFLSREGEARVALVRDKPSDSEEDKGAHAKGTTKGGPKIVDVERW